MHNFGRGMWRRISDHEKYQQSTNVQTNRLTHYFQTQKQRAIDAYSRIAISNEKKKVKEEVLTPDVTMNDVTDNYVIVEAVISEVETSVLISETKEEPSVLISEAKEETSVLISEAEAEAETSVLISETKAETSVLISEAEVETSVLSEAKAETSVLISEAEAEVETSVLSEAEPVIIPVSKSNAKKRRKNKEKV